MYICHNDNWRVLPGYIQQPKKLFDVSHLSEIFSINLMSHGDEVHFSAKGKKYFDVSIIYISLFNAKLAGKLLTHCHLKNNNQIVLQRSH